MFAPLFTHEKIITRIDDHFISMLLFFMRKFICISIITFFLSASAITSYADIYKYVDENGVIHFTNITKGKGYKKIISEDKTRSKKDYDHIITRKSSKYKIEPAIIRAVITVESNWNPRAISSKGAIGLMQLMPSTAKDMRVKNAFDPEENIEGGTKYLRYLLNRFNGDIELALAAYNAGPARVEKSGGIPSISETKKFVKKVLSIYKGKSGKKRERIYKVIYNNGTILYTNAPYYYKQNKLSNF